MKSEHERKAEHLDLMVGGEVSFSGTLTFSGAGRLDGNFEGEITSGSELIVGEQAVINADIKVETLIIQGRVNGNVSTTVKTVISSKGVLVGNLDTPTLVIEEGGCFEGQCRMGKKKENLMGNGKQIPRAETPARWDKS